MSRGPFDLDGDAMTAAPGTTKLSPRPSRNRRRWLLAALAGSLSASLGTTPAAAQSAYPNKSVALVVPFAAGGPVDAVGRVIGQHMAGSLGQAVVVENIAGAAGNIGAARVAASRPDGYTLLLASTALTINPALYTKPGYKVDAFDAIGSIGTSPLWLYVSAESPIQTLQQLLTKIREQPGRVRYGSGGSGTTSHLAVELLQKRLKLAVEHVPYKSMSTVHPDLIAQRTDFAFGPVAGSDSLVKSGRLRVLAVTGDKRLGGFPQVPTFAEAGVPGMDIAGWFGLVVPKGTPPEVERRLATALQAALASEQVRTLLTGIGIATKGSTPDEFRAFLKSETQRWGEIVAASGTKLD